MNIIFPAQPGSHSVIDPFWEKEYNAAAENGLNISLLGGSHFGAELGIHNASKEDKSIYRGWIIKPQTYLEMSTLNVDLLNSYEDYMWSHDFPKWYAELSNKETPNSFVFLAEEIQELGLEKIATLVSNRVGCRSLMIKDFLKSRKHEWFDACFIRDASDEDELVRIMSNFFKLQGRDFYGGLVFRDFLNLKKIGFHPKSRMPLPLEFRTFFINQKPFFTTPYWTNDAKYPEEIEYPPTYWLNRIGAKIKSPFVALDIAQGEDDKWWVIEVNDGGSAGLPDHVDLKDFYYSVKCSLNI